jgi:hypothetical protein
LIFIEPSGIFSAKIIYSTLMSLLIILVETPNWVSKA